MFHIDRAFRAQGRQVGAADVCMQRSERLSENGFIRRAAPRCGKRQPHGAQLTATAAAGRVAYERPDPDSRPASLASLLMRDLDRRHVAAVVQGQLLRFRRGA